MLQYRTRLQFLVKSELYQISTVQVCSVPRDEAFRLSMLTGGLCERADGPERTQEPEET